MTYLPREFDANLGGDSTAVTPPPGDDDTSIATTEYVQGEIWHWQGPFDGGTAYVVNDVVEYNGSSYIAIADTTGNLPTDPAYWELVALKGDDGSSGTNGVDGNTISSDTVVPPNNFGNDGDLFINETNGDLYEKVGGVWTLVGNLKGPQGDQGPQGIQGVQGDPGPAGADGAAGANGADGNSIFADPGSPSAGIGQDGDLYINESNGDLYEKVSGTWTLVGNLTGPQGAQGDPGPQGPAGNDGADGTNGADGEDGKSVFADPGAPSAGLGNNGDVYINETNGDLYEKIGGTWTLVGNLTGPAGADGADGTNGTNGTNGADGNSIYADPGAPAGGLGNDGDLYVNETNGDLYEKQSGSWVLVGNLTGPQGDQGPQGTQGVQGDPGPAGADGADGADGKSIYADPGAPSAGLGNDGDLYVNETNGDLYEKISGTWTVVGNLTGPQGPQGPQGPAGNDGADGANGNDGEDGKSIYADPGAPSAGLGVNGDLYINETNGDLYEKQSGTWVVVGNLTGPQGPQGDTGPQGPQGDPGPAGDSKRTIFVLDTEWSANAFTLTTEDYVIAKDSGANSTIYLPASPADGCRITIKKYDDANNITIDGNGTPIHTEPVGKKLRDGGDVFEFVYSSELDEWQVG